MYLFSVLKPLIKSNPSLHESWGPGVLRWGSWQQCEDGEFVTAMWVRLEEHEKWEDMSAVNGIRLQCSDGKNLNSAEGVKGEWSQLFVYRVQNLFDWAFGPKKPYHNAIVSVYVRSMLPCTKYCSGYVLGVCPKCDNEGVNGLRFRHLDDSYFRSPDSSKYKNGKAISTHDFDGIWGSANCPPGTAINGFRTEVDDG